MKLINLTPHDINIVADGTTVILETIPVSGVVARVGMEEEDLGRDGNIRFVRVRPGRPGRPVNVPEPRPGTLFIVSRAVQEALPERHDLIVPTHMVKSPDRRTIIGCAAFSVN